MSLIKIDDNSELIREASPTFTRVWNVPKEEGFSDGYTSLVFRTENEYSFSHSQAGPNHYEDLFRLDIHNEMDKCEVYIIGDSNEGGFLVCEEVTGDFDVEMLVSQAREAMLQQGIGHEEGQIHDAQEEFYEFMEEYED